MSTLWTVARRVFIGGALLATIALLCALFQQRAALAKRESTDLGSDVAFAVDAPPQASSPDAVPSLAAVRTVPEDAGAALVGTVVNEAGRPIHEARVAVLHTSDTSADAATLAAEGRLAVTDADGRFSFPARCEVGASGAILCARHVDYQAASCPVVEGAGPITVVMRTGLEISGRVLGPRGAGGLPGLHVVARGAGANVQTSPESTLSAPSMHVQHATTDSEGSFLLRGLPEGAYQLDVVEAGLVSFPGRWEVGPGFSLPQERAVWATAGRGERATLRVVPVAMALVQSIDASNGMSAVGASVRWTTPEGFLRFPFTLGNDPQVLVAGGVTVDLRSVAIGQSSAILVMSLSWPLRTQDVECIVAASGYKSQTVRVRLHAVGEHAASEPHVVAMQPLSLRGACRLVLRDTKGRGCGPVVFPLRFSTAAEAVDVNAVFDERGESQWLSLPAGTRKVEDIPEFEHAQIQSPVVVEIGADTQPEVSITLASGGVLVRALDGEDGRPLDDWGYRMGMGTAAPEPRMDYDPGSGTLRASGLFIRAPGTGGGVGAVELTPPGRWTVEVVRHGYRNGLKTIEVVPGEVADVTITMVRDAGIVVDEWQGRPKWHGFREGAILRPSEENR